MQIVALSRFPVKSMGGEACGQLTFEERGVAGDRVWAVRTADGGLGSGKTSRRFRRLVGLLDCSAALMDGAPQVSLPDGSTHAADSPVLAELLAALVGEPVTLTVEGDVPHHDDAPVHVMSTLDLEALAVRLDGPVDPRRFRSNVLVDGPLEPGMRLRLGDGPVLVVGDPMPRCVMVGMPQGGRSPDGVPEDRRVLKALPGESGPELGFMATVARGGTSAVGDEATVLPAGSL